MKKRFLGFLGFSLVELMISLITISCIAAAFTPVITKKLKKQDVALSLAQTSEITNQCSGYEPKFTDKCKLCTKTYCIQCPLDNCPNGKYLDLPYCDCLACSKNKNFIDSELTKNKCISCTKDVCMACNNLNEDEGKYYIKNGLCENCPSNKICDGINALDKAICDNPPNGYYCDGISLKTCISKYPSYCATCDRYTCRSCSGGYYLDGSKVCQLCPVEHCTSCDDGVNCKSCGAGWFYDLTSKKCNRSCENFFPHCQFCSGNTSNNGATLDSNAKCTACSGGYYLNTSTYRECISCESIANCIDCNNGKCITCKKGYYAKDGVCNSCGIANCASCNTNGKCVSCNQGFHLKTLAGNECVADDSKFNCSDSNFMQIGNLCVTRRNMGDSLMLPIPPTVSIAKAENEYCYAATTKCCWQGTITTNCIDEKNSYTTCDRTVCEWNAAKEICNKFDYGGRKWRLATKEELSNWSIYSVDLSDNGLSLCDTESPNYSNRCPNGSGRCKGSIYTYCYPDAIWSGTLDSTGLKAHRYYLTNSKWYGSGPIELSHPLGVRCVTEIEDD